MFKNLEKPVRWQGLCVFIAGLIGTLGWTILMFVAGKVLMAILILVFGFLASYIVAVPYMAIYELYGEVRAIRASLGSTQDSVKSIARTASVKAQTPAPAAKTEAEGNVEKKPVVTLISAAKLIDVALQYRTAEGTYEYLKNNFGKLSEEDQAALDDVAALMKKRDIEGMIRILAQKKEAMG